ncbi:MAG TPA: hypothetical protein VED65_00820 [Candidatus Bathyarchaeia archaeon]|nr:hypothetical protein [Candidatus Bathyarchaeia archaeon]
MRRTSCKRSGRGSESGYALILVVFFLALLVLALSEAAPTVLSNIQREKEKEMVWRGKQYTRGIRMYYLKNNRFPTSLDDLTQNKTGIRFMRQAYKDPMNQTDGSWRLIYVGPNGQLIGSLNTQQSLSGLAQLGTPAVTISQSGGSSMLSGGSNFASGNSGMSSSITSFGSNQTAGGGQSSAFGSTFGSGTTGSTGTSATASTGTGDASTDPGQPHSLAGPMDASNTIGGNIIGVGSKIDKKSFLVYQKAKNYKLFEFIWDPSKDISVGGASAGIGTPVQNMNGTNPAGAANPSSPFSTGMNPGMNPGQSQSPAQSPNPSPNQSPGTMPETPLQAPPNQ